MSEADGRKCVYTIGCGDPFFLDEKPRAVRFCKIVRVWGGHEEHFHYSERPVRIDRPPMATELAKQREKERRAYEAEQRRPRHSWRGPR